METIISKDDFEYISPDYDCHMVYMIGCDLADEDGNCEDYPFSFPPDYIFEPDCDLP